MSGENLSIDQESSKENSAGFEFAQLAIIPEFVGKSAPGLCVQSPDEGRHHWYRVAWLQQSLELDECGFCHETLYD